jgi:TP901 family phage tail tape measure protein
MLVVKAVTSATANEFDSMTARAKLLGRTTSYTAAEVADAMVNLGRAGFDPDMMLGSIDHVLALARATDTELAEAARIAAASMRGFNLSASDMARISDVLSATANGSAQTLTDLGEAMKMVAPIAMEAGASVEDVSAMIATLANNAIIGTMAGTALARAYKNLAAEKTANQMREIGVAVADASGNMRPMSDILSDIGKATAGMGSKQKLAIFETLFGRGSAAALKLAAPSASLDSFRAKLDDVAGSAAATAKEMDSGLGGSFRKVMSAIEGGLIAIGKTIEAPLQTLTDAGTIVAGLFTTIVEQHPKTVAAVAGIAAGLTALGVALMGVGFVSIFAGAGIGAIATVIATVTGALTATISPALLVGGAIAGIGAGLLYLARNTKPVQAVGQAIGTYASGLGDMVSTVVSDATTAWGGIKAAISSGDTEAAMTVVTSTLKLLWARVVSFWMEKTSKFRSWWSDVSYKFSEVFIDAVAGIQKAWATMLNWMQKQWIKWETNLYKSKWYQNLVGKASEALGGPSAEEVKTTMLGMASAKRTKQRIAASDAKMRETKAEIEADRKSRQADLAAQKAKDDKERLGSVARAKADLEQARKDRDAAVAAAKKGAEDAAAKKKSGVPDFGGDFGGGLAAVGKASIAGTFSASAAAGLGTGSVLSLMRQFVIEGKKTSKNTKDMADAQKDLNMELAK